MSGSEKRLSEVTLSSSEIKSWLESETGSVLTPVQAQAQKLRDEARKVLQGELDASKMLFDNSTKEIEKRNMKVYNRARALNKLARLFTDRIKKIQIPEQVSYDSLSKFAQETQKAFAVTDVDIRNWFPRISPFFIMDRRKFLVVHEKSKLTIAMLSDFVAKEYSKTKTLEDTYKLIPELQALEKQLSDAEAQQMSLKNERLAVEKEIAELEQKSTLLKDNSVIQQLSAVEAEIDALGNELKNELRHLQKPFVKMQALALQGGGAGLTQDQTTKLGQYLDAPFDALASEVSGYPVLKQILERLSVLLSEDKLKLKPDKARKAEQELNSILKQDALDNIYKKCVAVESRRRQLLASPEIEETRHNLSLLHQQIESLRIKRDSIQIDEQMRANAHNELSERIQNHKKTIEANIQSFLGKQIHIQ